MLQSPQLMQQIGRKVAVASPAYSGPGDVSGLSGAFAYWGLRGYNAAYATGSNPAIDVVDTATGLLGPTTINIKSNGSLDTATILGLGYAVSVSKIYDQSGNGRHMTQATLGNMATLNTTGVTSLVFTGSSSQFYLTVAITLAQAFSASFILNRTDAVGANLGFFFNNNTANLFEHRTGSPGHFGMNWGAGSVVSTVNYTLGTTTAVQYLVNGASSSIYEDGTNTTGLNAGSGAFSSDPMQPANVVGGASIQITEMIFWSGDKSGSFSNLNSNQHTGWGF